MGKTTAIREMSRLLSANFNQELSLWTPNEIGGDGDVAHPGVETRGACK